MSESTIRRCYMVVLPLIVLAGMVLAMWFLRQADSRWLVTPALCLVGYLVNLMRWPLVWLSTPAERRAMQNLRLIPELKSALRGGKSGLNQPPS